MDVNYHSLHEPSLYAAEDVMYTMFELDEHYDLPIHDFDGKKCVAFNTKLLDDLFAEWQVRKKTLPMGLSARSNIWNGSLTGRRLPMISVPMSRQSSGANRQRQLTKMHCSENLLSKYYQQLSEPLNHLVR